MDKEQVKKNSSVAILGGGPAGVVMGHLLSKKKVKFHIYEDSSVIGGNAKTYKVDEFYFDSGAHRFHNKNLKVSNYLSVIMGQKLKIVSVLSHIVHKNKLINFPISPINLFIKLGFIDFLFGGLSLIKSKICALKITNFDTYTVSKYGRHLSTIFIHNYSKKLWGKDVSLLSTSVSGKRLDGLGVNVIKGELSGKGHLDGSFLYPDFGIGTIFDQLISDIDAKSINLNSRVEVVNWADDKIISILVNGVEKIADEFISSIPLDHFVRSLNPPCPKEIIELTEDLEYRHLKIVCLMINESQLTNSGTLYFPSDEYIFTRVFEPIIRSKTMAPQNKTSLVIEIPCNSNDEVWTTSDEELTKVVINQLARVGIDIVDQVIGSFVQTAYNAYPVQTLVAESSRLKILEYTSKLKNLNLVGRNGRFDYIHIHDVFEQCFEIDALFKPNN
jgi:protoporphyrinogen oxidase